MKRVNFSVQLTTICAASIALTVSLALFIYHFQVASQTGELYAEIDHGWLVRILLIAGGVSLLVGHMIGRGFSRRIEALAAGAQRIAAGDLATPISISGHDELAQLALTFNQMAARLQTSLAQQQTLEQARRDLVANVAHDLRTPLAATQAAVEALEEGVVKDQATTAHYLAVVGQQTRYLARLIDDLFMFSRLEAHQLDLNLTAVYLENIVQSCLAGLLPQLERKGLSLAIDLPADLPAAWADPHATSRVLTNLLQNALAFTPPGGQITVRGTAHEDALQLEVSDTGPGLPASDLEPGAEGRPHIFERFYRGDQARPGGGAGLGLAIVHELVQLQGGRVWARNEAGSGATIGFSLPKSTYRT